MKSAKFTLKGSEIELGIGTSIDISELYGSAKRIVVKDNEELIRGTLTPDGRLYAKDDISRTQQDSNGCYPLKATVQTEDGQVAVLHNSTFKETRELEPLENPFFPNFAVSTVYPVVAPESISLGAYKTQFAYKDTNDLADAILIVRNSKTLNAREAFLLVGETKDAPEIGPIVNYNFFESEEVTEEEESGELAFGV